MLLMDHGYYDLCMAREVLAVSRPTLLRPSDRCSKSSRLFSSLSRVVVGCARERTWERNDDYSAMTLESWVCVAAIASALFYLVLVLVLSGKRAVEEQVGWQGREKVRSEK